MHLLIPYIQLHPADPAFDEFTYGDGGSRARKLKSQTNKGDYIFFHTSKGGKKYITGYYVIDRVLDTVEACQEKAIRTKYKNPHILECLEGKRPLHGEDDAIVFGDPILSNRLERPLRFDRKLVDKLSLGVKFPSGRTEQQIITSATRAWRELTNEDVRILLKEIASERNRPRPQRLRSIEEVAETIEKDVEDFIALNPKLIGNGLRLVERQSPIGAGRFDLLFEDGNSNLILVEVKLNRIGRDAFRQIQSYVHDLRQERRKRVKGILVCSGVMPAYESDLQKQKDIRILVYGWDLKVQNW